MRRVALNELQRPAGWDETAAAALSELDVAPDAVARRQALAANQGVWQALKPGLEKLSTKKCWFCEARQCRSDKHVEHFRPKGKLAAIEPPHSGYWWLAFSARNLRYSCTYCNSRRTNPETGHVGGKGSYFPIRSEADRARQPGDQVAAEQPVLLDPTVQADVLLLWFDEDGNARPAVTDLAPWPHERAVQSIDLYNLNHVDIREARLAVAAACKNLVDLIDDAWVAYSQGVPAAEALFTSRIGDLDTTYLLASAEFSAMARSTLRGLRSPDRPWLEALIA